MKICSLPIWANLLPVNVFRSVMFYFMCNLGAAHKAAQLQSETEKVLDKSGKEIRFA